LPSKRKSRGRSKGSKGSSSLVQCANCGAMVPRDKAKRNTRRVSFVEPQLAKELRQKGTFLASWVDTKYYLYLVLFIAESLMLEPNPNVTHEPEEDIKRLHLFSLIPCKREMLFV